MLHREASSTSNRIPALVAEAQLGLYKGAGWRRRCQVPHDGGSLLAETLASRCLPHTGRNLRYGDGHA
jgi:hypothetical protein